MSYLSRLFALLFFVIASQQAFTQNHQFSVGAGFVSSCQVLDIFSDFLSTTISLGSVTTESQKSTSSLFASYTYSSNDRFRFGATFVYEKIDKDLVNQLDDSDLGESTSTYLTPALEGTFVWVDSDNLELYSTVGLGFTFISNEYRPADNSAEETTNDSMFNLHATALGLRLGNQIAFFGELGFGYRGILCAGLSARF